MILVYFGWIFDYIKYFITPPEEQLEGGAIFS